MNGHYYFMENQKIMESGIKVKIYEYDVRYDLEEALAEIDKAIGGKEDE